MNEPTRPGQTSGTTTDELSPQFTAAHVKVPIAAKMLARLPDGKLSRMSFHVSAPSPSKRVSGLPKVARHAVSGEKDIRRCCRANEPWSGACIS